MHARESIGMLNELNPASAINICCLAASNFGMSVKSLVATVASIRLEPVGSRLHSLQFTGFVHVDKLAMDRKDHDLRAVRLYRKDTWD